MNAKISFVSRLATDKKRLFLLNLTNRCGLSIILFLAVFAFNTFGQGPIAAIETRTPVPADIRAQDFDRVWKTVNDKHFDPTFGGVDWQKVREKYEPLATAAKTDDEFYGILQKMLGELHQSHFSVTPPYAVISADSFGAGEIGIDLQMIGKQAVINRVEKDSPAEVSGLKTGFVIEKIDGKTVADLLAPLEERLKTRTDTEALKMLYRNRRLLKLVSGGAGTTVKLDVLDRNDKPAVFEVVRARYKGEMSLPVGNFPGQPVVFESRMLPENIGYIRFNIWVIPQMAKLRAAITGMGDARGLIIDLRGNPGGVGGMASGIAGWLVNKRTSLGTMKSRGGETNFSVYPQSGAFLKKVVVLIDSESASTSEVFAAGLQDLGRAKIVGATSAGAVLPSYFEKLPSGALFQYVIADYKSPKKVLVEGRGVAPDIAVDLTRSSLIEGRDIFIETAVKEILK